MSKQIDADELLEWLYQEIEAVRLCKEVMQKYGHEKKVGLLDISRLTYQFVREHVEELYE